MASNNIKLKTASCGNCNSKTGVKWKCKDCDKYLCTACKNQHQKARATQKHVILERLKKSKDQSEQQQNSTQLSNVKNSPIEEDDTVTYAFCSKHKSQLSQWYCNSCCVQVCKTCISIDHESHVIAEVASLLQKRERKLVRYTEHVEGKYLNDAVDRRKKLKELKVNFDNNIITMKREVWLRYDEFMLKLGQQRDELTKQLDNIQKTEEIQFVRANETITNEVETLEGLVMSLRNMLDAVRSGKLEGDPDTIKSSLENLKRRDPPNPPKLSFKSSTITDSMVCNMYGKLESKVLRSSKPQPVDTHSPMSSPELEITVLSSFSTTLPFVKSLCPMSETDAWIACWQCNEIRHVTSKGKETDLLKMTAMDLASLPNGDLLVAQYSQCSIQCLRQDGVLCEYKNTSPLYPTGICVSESGDIYVSLVDRYDLKIEENSVRRLVQMDLACKHKLTVEYNGRDERLLTYPAKVTVNINDDICIVDETGQYSGRLVVADRSGEVKFVYGETDVMSGETCDLSSCACDAVGRILVTDWLHHKIHIVSKEGYFMGYLMSREDGIFFPFSLAFISDGSLWIGCKLSSDSSHGDVVRIEYEL